MQRPWEDTWCPALPVETCSLSHPTAGLMAGKSQGSSNSALKGTVESRAEDTALYMVAGIGTGPASVLAPWSIYPDPMNHHQSYYIVLPQTRE